MEFSVSQRGNRVMVYEGFAYLFYRETSCGASWRCQENKRFKCHAVIKTLNDTIIKANQVHSHDSCPQKVEKNMVMNEMKIKITALGATSRNVIGEVCQNLHNDVLQHLPKKSSIERCLRRVKQNQYTELPRTPNFGIPEEYKNMVLFDTGEDDPGRILAIGDKTVLPYLDTKADIFGDGTFDKVPTVYFQLYTWHVRIGNSYPPCIYFLLPNKTQITYSKMFHVLKSLLPNIAPSKIYIDFEMACISATRAEFPNADIKGCYFHLCQSVLRKAQTLGLKSRYENDVSIKLMIKSLSALSFVPVADVKTVFQQLATVFPEEDCFTELLNYFYMTYIEGAAGRNPKFEMNIWNHMDSAAEGGPKTTNCCEGYHNTLNSLFQFSHPSVWLFFDGIKRDISCHKITIANVQIGLTECRRNKYVMLQKQVAAIVQNYYQCNDKLQYIRSLANLQ